MHLLRESLVASNVHHRCLDHYNGAKVGTGLEKKCGDKEPPGRVDRSFEEGREKDSQQKHDRESIAASTMGHGFVSVGSGRESQGPCAYARLRREEVRPMEHLRMAGPLQFQDIGDLGQQAAKDKDQTEREGSTPRAEGGMDCRNHRDRL